AVRGHRLPAGPRTGRRPQAPRPGVTAVAPGAGRRRLHGVPAMNAPVTPDPPSADALLAEAADDFMDRLGRGEQPAVEDYARRYPELADVLRQVLPALCVLQPPDPASGGGIDRPDAGFEGARQLGDFRIVREVGRGGMGLVFEAVQLSL